MRIYRLLAALFLVQLSVVAAEALQLQRYNVKLSDVINTVEKPFRLDDRGLPELENVRADFFQRSTIAAKKKEYRADGEMSFKPATRREALKFRFEYFRPARQDIICDGKVLWIYLPENRQAILSDVGWFLDPLRGDQPKVRAVNFLQGLGRISRDFTIVFGQNVTDQAGNYLLELTPNRASVSIEKLFITVNKESVKDLTGTRTQVNAPAAHAPESHLFPILSTTVVDHDGNSTTMEFSHIKINGMMTDMDFNFSPPADVQVVRPPTGR